MPGSCLDVLCDVRLCKAFGDAGCLSVGCLYVVARNSCATVPTCGLFFAVSDSDLFTAVSAVSLDPEVSGL